MIKKWAILFNYLEVLPVFMFYDESVRVNKEDV
jgi:hypothetical protein